jgi:hypothetical protein
MYRTEKEKPMPALKTVYMMAFTPEKMDTNMLMAVCQMAAKDRTFAQRMGTVDKDTG